MDHRIKALMEVRDLLEAEGWAPPPVEPECNQSVLSPVTQSSWPRQSIITFLCVVSIFVNIFLIANLHDFRDQSLPGRATIALVEIAFNLPDYPTIHSMTDFLTIDGTEIWRRSPGPDSSMKLDFEKTTAVEFSSRCVVQLWRKPQSDLAGRPILLAQVFVTTIQAGPAPFEIDLLANDGSSYRLKARIAEVRSSFSR